MSLKRKASTSKDGGDGDFPILAQGTYPAVCVAVIVTGTHSEAYPGKPASDVEKVYLAWEVIGELMPNSKFNFVMGREFTLSLNSKANLRKLIDNWRSTPLKDDEEFDLSMLKGQPCVLTVSHTNPNSEGKVFANVTGVARPMKGQTAAKPTRTPFVYEEVSKENGLPEEEWLPRIYGQTVADRIKDSNEWKAGSGSAAPKQEEEESREPAGELAPAGGFIPF